MKHIVNYINKISKKLSWGMLIYPLILLIFLINSSYLSYPDEFVNIMAGKFINLGRIPYLEFFDHHLPFAWYLAAFILKFSFNSFVIFRTIWTIIIFASFAILGLYFRKSNKEIYPYYLIFFFLTPFIMVYSWLHLFLADSLAFIFFSLIFWLLISESYKNKTHSKTIFFTSVLNFIFIFSSLTFIYIGFVFYLWMFYVLVRRGLNIKILTKYCSIAIAPYILYFVYLLLTGSLKDFYFANVIYNTELYMSIPNYVRGAHFNPLKFVLTLIFNFYQNYVIALVKVKDLNIFMPLANLFAWGSFLLLLILFFENKILFFLSFLILSFSAPRSNVVNIPETDYQASLYIALGLISSLLVLWRYKKLILNEAAFEYFKKVSVFLLFVFLLFSSLFLIKNTYDKFYQIYTQKMPHIYDLSYTAGFLDDILEKNDYFWVGPYEPQEAFFVKKSRLPGKYVSLMPQFRENSYFSQSFLAQFEKNKPSIVVFKHISSVFNTPADIFGKFFLDWLKGKYTNIRNFKNYTIVKSPSSFEFANDVYLLNEKKEILLDRLVTQGYLKHL